MARSPPRITGAWLTPSVGVAASWGSTEKKKPASTAPNRRPTPDTTALSTAASENWSPNATAWTSGFKNPLSEPATPATNPDTPKASSL